MYLFLGSLLRSSSLKIEIEGGGFGPGMVPGQIPDNYFSARGTGHTPRSSVNYSPRSSENFSPRSSVSEGPFARAPSDAASDERSRLVRK